MTTNTADTLRALYDMLRLCNQASLSETEVRYVQQAIEVAIKQVRGDIHPWPRKPLTVLRPSRQSEE